MDLVVQEKKNKTLIVCPGTDDGIAASVLLSRSDRTERSVLYLPENAVAQIADYPALRGFVDRTNLVLAGFSFNDAVRDWGRGSLPENTTWYSHHFWSETGTEVLGAHGVNLIHSSDFSTTSELIRKALGLEGKIERGCAEILSRATLPEDPFWRKWFFASLAVRQDYYGIRKVFSGLFDDSRMDSEPPGEYAAAGETIFNDFEEMIVSSNPHSFPIGRKFEARALGLPKSLRPHFRILSRLAFRHWDCALAFFLIDGDTQILILRNEEYSSELPHLELTGALDRVLDESRVRLFDRNTYVIENQGDPVGIMDKISRDLHV
jgi:hypothetical protein